MHVFSSREICIVEAPSSGTPREDRIFWRTHPQERNGVFLKFNLPRAWGKMRAWVCSTFPVVVGFLGRQPTPVAAISCLERRDVSQTGLPWRPHVEAFILLSEQYKSSVWRSQLPPRKIYHGVPSVSEAIHPHFKPGDGDGSFITKIIGLSSGRGQIWSPILLFF